MRQGSGRCGMRQASGTAQGLLELLLLKGESVSNTYRARTMRRLSSNLNNWHSFTRNLDTGGSRTLPKVKQLTNSPWFKLQAICSQATSCSLPFIFCDHHRTMWYNHATPKPLFLEESFLCCLFSLYLQKTAGKFQHLKTTGIKRNKWDYIFSVPR